MTSEGFKQVCVGSGGVGKSCIIIQFITNKFIEDYDPTLEDSYRKILDIDEKPAVLDIYDTAGQEDFAAVRDSYLRMGDGFICVYSITCRKSFNEVKTLYSHIFKVKDLGPGERYPFVLLGNKCDCAAQREVPTSEGEALAKEWGCSFFETSAKDKIRIPDGFIALARAIRSFAASVDALGDRDGNSSIGADVRYQRRRRACALF